MCQRHLRGCAIHDVNGRFDRRAIAINRAPIKRDTKDVVETQIDVRELRQISVAIEGLVGLILRLLKQGDDFLDVRFVQDSARLPYQQIQIATERINFM